MIKNHEKLIKFNREIIKNTPADYKKNLAIVEALHAEANELLKNRPRDYLAGIELKIKLAKVLNSV